MKMDKVAGSGNDEFYTPEYAVKPILEFIEPYSDVLCPFDTEESNFVKMLYNRNVTYSHLWTGKDFWSYTDDELRSFDYVVSNPPYSQKTEILNRLFESNVAFAMLVGVVGLFESQKRFEMFRDHDFEIMYFNRRVSYLDSYSAAKPQLNPPFSSVYVCRGVLPYPIMFKEIQK